MVKRGITNMNGVDRDAQITDKELAFAREYAMDWNKTQAAIRAGYSEESARYIGYELLEETLHFEMVRNIQSRAVAGGLELNIDWVIEQFFDCYVAAREKGELKAATKALENIGKMLGGYEKHNKQKRDITPAEAEAIRERLKERGVNFDRVNDRSGN